MSWVRVQIMLYLVSLIGTCVDTSDLLPRQYREFSTLDTSVDIITPILTTATAETTTTTTVTAKDVNQLECVEDECNPRLLSNLEVDSYELKYIYESFNDTKVQGYVTINFTLKQATRQLIYHAKRMLELDEPALFENGVYRHVNMRQYAHHDYVSLRLRAPNSLFATNRYVLKQRFIVSVIDGHVGFYQSVFTDGNAAKQKLLASKFQPTDARKAFPCFDEPHLKAIFKITIIHPPNSIAIANFPSIQRKFENGLSYTKFADTFRMSTYLAAWAILPDTYGRYANHNDERNVTVWARKEPTDKGHTALALEIALHSVSFFTDYFNTSEPVTPKIDLLAVPDFASGAMENWGLVSFREDRIIFDEKIASTLQKQQLGETMAHEIAHFWFGNYVTCKWWDNLWLNEAMATWLSYKPFITRYADWNMELQALTEEVIPVMWTDAKPSSHAVVVRNVTDTVDITSLFDAITYSKGAGILRMLEKIVGSETFRDGLRDYLQTNAFGMGDPTVFYNKLFTNISGEKFMKNWLQESNYPILGVHLKMDDNGTYVTFNQSRFILSDVLDSSKLDSNYRWMINIECVLGGNQSDSNLANLSDSTIKFMLETEQETLFLSDKFYTWIKCNRDFQGFYVTKYSSDLLEPSIWQRLSFMLETYPSFFSDEDKVNLLHDSFLLAYKGLIDYMEPLRIVKSLVKINSKQYVIWRTFQWYWELLADLVEYIPNTWTHFKRFAIEQILATGETVDDVLTATAADNHETRLLKGLQFSLLCRMGHEIAIDRASKLFKSIPVEYFHGYEVDINVGPDFLSTVYICHLKNDDNETDWTTMYEYYKSALSPQEQTRALIAISSTTNRDRLNRLLDEGITIGSSKIKRQDFFSMIAYMSRHPTGREVAWTFYKDNYQKLIDIFSLENRRLGITISLISRSFQSESDLEELKEVYARYPNAGTGAVARKQAVNQMNMNMKWVRTREPNLLEALKAMV